MRWIIILLSLCIVVLPYDNDWEIEQNKRRLDEIERKNRDDERKQRERINQQRHDEYQRQQEKNAQQVGGAVGNAVSTVGNHIVKSRRQRKYENLQNGYVQNSTSTATPRSVKQQWQDRRYLAIQRIANIRENHGESDVDRLVQTIEAGYYDFQAKEMKGNILYSISILWPNDNRTTLSFQYFENMSYNGAVIIKGNALIQHINSLPNELNIHQCHKDYSVVFNTGDPFKYSIYKNGVIIHQSR